MTKAENRAAAKAHQQEKERRWREEARAAAVAADLEEIRKLRDYLIFRAKARVSTRDLIDAIDDYAEKLTGDRRTLHGHGHSIG
jgi:acetyl-CoA carboxylase alpha subunit